MIRGIQRLAKDMSLKVVRQEAIADNLANATTPGFKSQRAFASMLKTTMGSGQASLSTGPAAEIYTDFSQGPIEQTDRNLDLAIEGDGLFAIDTPLGERYTRCGNFTLTDQGVLVTQAGSPVLGSSGPIMVSGQGVTITSEGKVFVDNSEVNSLRIVVFDNPQTLTREGNMFAPTSEECRECDMKGTSIIQGALERSNAGPIDEMVEMITIHRNFEAEQKSITLQDESSKQLIDRLGSFKST